jgi:hypothetical protein
MRLALGPQSVRAYHSPMETETRKFLLRLISDPSNHAIHIRRYVQLTRQGPKSCAHHDFSYTGGLILRTIYGYEIQYKDDEFIALGQECVSLLSRQLSGGRLWLVDIFPLCESCCIGFPCLIYVRNK